MSWSLVSWGLVSSLLGAGGCGGGFDDPLDEVPLLDSPPLVHIARALGEAGDRTAGELLEDELTELAYLSAPDPSELLATTAALDDELEPDGRVPLRVLTLNVGLVDLGVFGLIDIVESPLLEERRRGLADLVFEQEADALLLQELWMPDDVERFRASAQHHGYQELEASHKLLLDGLFLFVRAALVTDEPVVEVLPYDDQFLPERVPGLWVHRALLVASFAHPTLGRMVLATTHLSPRHDWWRSRSLQSRQMGLWLRERYDDDTLLIAGGDLNSGPYYAKRQWLRPDGGVDAFWWQNATAYALLLHYGGLTDLAIMGRSPEDALADVTFGRQARNDPAWATTLPGAVAGWCETVGQVTFTGTDCNTLFFSKYAGEEPPARLDHVLGRARPGRILVERSALALTEPVLLGGVWTEPSDHYGVVVDLLVEP